MTARIFGIKHGKAIVEFEDIKLMRELYESHGLQPHEIANKFEVSINTLWDWLLYRTRVNQ
jgi:orotate phosphoribosyltransferase-like protein